MKFSVYQVSRRGGRETNEDRVGYSYSRDAGLFAVADGMGGHPQGEVAAQLALQTLSARFDRECRPRLADPLAFLQQAIIAGHHQLRAYGERRSMPDTPRTTVVACLLQDDQAYWAHCGDSRLYLMREHRLLQRTRDHSFAELASLRPDEVSPQQHNRNVLFTCLGSPGLPVIDLAGPMQLRAGDRLLLCSDGLWGVLAEDELLEGLCNAPLDQAVPGLAQLALTQGGARCDNVTALAIEWEAGNAADAAALAPGAMLPDPR